MDQAPSKDQREMVLRYSSVLLPMARDCADVFQLLKHFHPGDTWEHFVSCIDFSGSSASDIYQAVLGSNPLSDLLHPDNHKGAGAHFRTALLAPEFRRQIQRIFLLAHPDKARDIFIHIPKCAGTDLIMSLGTRIPPLPKMLEMDGWIASDDFLSIISGLSRSVASNERIFTYGHMSLATYVAEIGIRPVDSVFTVLRDPVDLMVSQANYVVGRLRQDPEGNDPDSAQYLRQLGMSRLSPEISIPEMKAIAVRSLLHPGISGNDRACAFLGRGNESRYDHAIRSIISNDVEVTTTEFYDRWLQERWGIENSRHHNRSETVMTRTEIMRLARSKVTEATIEDQKLFDLISWSLRESGWASVKGSAIPQIVGPQFLDCLYQNEIPSAVTEGNRRRDKSKIIVAERPHRVATFLAPVAELPPGLAIIESVLSIDFTQHGNSRQFNLKGWASPEVRHTWTAGIEASLTLPVPRGPGRLILQLVASAFIDRVLLPTQTVEVLMNGQLLAVATLSDQSVVECEIPESLSASEDELKVTLRLPKATVPRMLKGANDDRLIALAVHEMSVLRVIDTIR